MSDQASRPSTPNNEMSLLDFLMVPLKRKQIILTLTFGTAILSFIYSLFMPKLYTATAMLLPPQDSGSGLRVIGSLSGGVGAMLDNFQGKISAADLYMGILKSRSAADEVIKRFDLEKVYGENSRSTIYKILSDRTRVEVSGKTQIITLSVMDSSAERAADMVGAFVEALDLINRKVNITEGRRKRIFLEKRLTMVKADLNAAEKNLMDFQQKFKLIAVEDQARTIIEAAAKIKAEIMSTETELEVMKQFRTENLTETRILKAKISELKKQLEKIETGTLKKNDGDDVTRVFDSAGTSFSFNEIPGLSMQLGRLLREAKVQENVFELLISQYELAKIEEAKDMDVVQVLDKAFPPDKKSTPNRFLIMLLSGGSALLIAIFLSFYLEYLDFVKGENPVHYQEFINALKSWEGFNIFKDDNVKQSEKIDNKGR